MKPYRAISLTLILALLGTASCAKEAAPSASSTAGALTANSSSIEAPVRPFERHMLSVSGLHSMTEFMRPEIRNRLDQEPVGDADTSFDPSAMDSTSSSEQSTGESSEPQAQEEQQQPEGAEESSARSDLGKYLWAKKTYGDAIKANPANTGVIVLYADEDYYDLNSLMSHVEGGRDRIAEKSVIGTERIQVVFGGYRSAPQIELWVIPQGAPMPQFKTDDRNKSGEPE